MNRSILTVTIVLFLVNCTSTSQQEIDAEQIEQELELLVTKSLKREYLERIFEQDQYYRKRDSEIIESIGYDSKEHKENTALMMRNDVENVLKMDGYLKKFEYPDPVEFGTDAANTPWLVIHHSTDTGIRYKYFNILYKAYSENKIDDNAFALYLDRTYMFVFGESFEMSSPYQMDDRIEKLIELLEMEESKG